MLDGEMEHPYPRQRECTADSLPRARVGAALVYGGTATALMRSRRESRNSMSSSTERGLTM